MALYLIEKSLRRHIPPCRESFLKVGLTSWHGPSRAWFTRETRATGGRPVSLQVLIRSWV
jgi:hypothetical protein